MPEPPPWLDDPPPGLAGATGAEVIGGACRDGPSAPEPALPPPPGNPLMLPEPGLLIEPGLLMEPGLFTGAWKIGTGLSGVRVIGDGA
ncbi:Uncharacterised protein [Mycolicibacterium phlei]|nr:Uncharacterised protein [Mycolicibacterium phlei]